MKKISCVLIILLIFFITSAARSEQKKRVAILDFTAENVDNSYAKAVRNVFEVALYKTDTFEIVERNQMEAILQEHGLTLSGCIDASCAVKIGQLLSADMVVMGSVNKIGEYVITVKFVDVRTGSIKLADSETASLEGYINNLVKQLADRTADKIGEGVPERKEEKAVESEADKQKRQDERKAREASAAAKKLSISANGSYIYPLQRFADLVKPGYGGSVYLNMENQPGRNLFAGIETGYWLFPGNKVNADTCSMAIAVFNFGYRFNLFWNLYLVPAIGGGLSYINLKYDYDGLDDQGNATYASKTSVETMCKAGLSIEYRVAGSILLHVRGDFGSIFEKKENLYVVLASAGIGIIF